VTSGSVSSRLPGVCRAKAGRDARAREANPYR